MQLLDKFVYFIFLMAIFDRRDFKYLDNIGVKPMLQARVTQLKFGQDLIHRPNFLQSKTKDGRERSLTAGKLRLTRLQGLKLTKLVMDIAVVNILLQCNDISLNPGPNNRGLICPIYDKTSIVCASRYHYASQSIAYSGQ